MSREEAAAKAQYEAVTGKPWESAPALSAKLCREDSAAIAKGLEAYDAAHGVFRLVMDEETIERVARARYEAEGGDWDTAREFDKAEWLFDVRAVLAAAVGGEA